MSTDRRQFVAGIAGITSGLLTWSCKTTGSASDVASRAAASAPAAATGRIRRSVWDLDPDGSELSDYRKAITAMLALPATDHRSWQNQAQIHLNNCPHSNWFFVTWHRAYLYYFEQLIQKYSGNPNFALPYWDWTQHEKMPPAFTDSKNNPLFHPGRNTRDLADANVGANVIKRIMALNDFQSFGGSRTGEQRGDADPGLLESTPHNYVHSFLGGDMGTFLSPLDPIFWLHHCNIDRLWAEWSLAHPDTNLPTDPAADDKDNAAFTRDFWLNFTLAGYFDVNGNPITAKPSDTLTTTSYGYSYPTTGKKLALVDTTTAPQKREKITYAVQQSGVSRTDDHLTFSIPVDQPIIDAFNVYMNSVNTNPNSACIRLQATQIPVPNDLTVQIRVFLNHPALDANVTDDDPHFVGRYAFFSGAHAGHGGTSRSLAFELSSVVNQLFASTNDLGTSLNIQVQVTGEQITAIPSAEYFQPIQLNLTWVVFV